MIDQIAHLARAATWLRRPFMWLSGALLAIAIASSSLLLQPAVNATAPRPAVAASVLLLGTALCVLGNELRRGEPFSPLAFAAWFTALTFGVRPLYLLLNLEALEHYSAPTSSTRLTDLSTQEITLFLTTHFSGSLEATALTAVSIGGLFFVAFSLAYWAYTGRRRQPTASRRTYGASRLTKLTLAGAFIGLCAQAYMLTRVGGVSAALRNVNSQVTLQVPFVVGIAAALPMVLAVAWVSLAGPRTVREWAIPAALLADQVIFWLATGSRARALAPLLATIIATHFAVRRWRSVELLLLVLAFALAGSILLVARDAATNGPAHALSSASGAGGNLTVAVNDASQFDAVVEMVALSGNRGPEAGARMASSFVSLLPDPVLPGAKPEPSDIWFRKAIWADRFQAGRPFTLAGEAWLDFRWLGVLIVALLLGLAASMAVHSIRGNQGCGGLGPAYYAFSVTAFSSLLSNSYTLGLSAAIGTVGALALLDLALRGD